MTINFFNHDIGGARFGLLWDADKETPAIALNPGDMASFDLDVFNDIPDGTNCKIFAFYKGAKIFTRVPSKYVKGRGFGVRSIFTCAATIPF
jgi:hypothetical protein